MFVIKEYRHGKKIIRQGTHGTSAFLIKKGTVEVMPRATKKYLPN